MKKFRLICCLLLLLTHDFSRSAQIVQGEDTSTSSLRTLQSRREALSQRIAERENLLTSADSAGLVKVDNQIVELHLLLRDLDSALTEVTDSLKRAREIANSNASLLVDTLNLSARVYISRNDNPSAQRQLTEALQLSRNQGYRHGEAEAQTQLGFAYYAIDKISEAEQSNNEALRIWRELQDSRGQARILAAQGETYMLRDRGEEASAAFETAATLWRSLDDPAELANTLIDQNFLAIRQGQWQTALVYLNEAQGLVTDKKAEPFIAGKIAMSFGEVYEAYGQLETALTFFREAMTNYRDALDKRAVIDASNKAGRVQARLGDYEGARQQIEQGIAAAIETGNNLTIGLCHEDLGRVWLEANSYEPARLEFLTAIDYFTKSKSERLWARAQSYLGQTEHLLGNLNLAAIAYEKALRIFQKTPDYTNEAALRFGLGKLALQQGDYDKAEEHLRRSMELTERLRENASSRDLRSSFLASVHDRYETYVEWLMGRYSRERNERFAIEAFEANEAGHARSLLDFLYGYQRELRRPKNPQLLIEEEKLQKEEQRLIDIRSKVLSRAGPDVERASVESQLTDIHARYEALQARIDSNTNFANLLRPKSLNYETIRNQITDNQTSLLAYSLGTGKSFAWVVSQDGLQSFELADKRTIENVATEVVRLLQSPTSNSAEETRLQSAIDELSRLVLEPVATKLSTARLIIVGDGVLQYIPFQILKASANSKEQMISRFDIVTAPSASALAIVRRERMSRQPGPQVLVGFGDAVFSSNYLPPGSDMGNTNSTTGRSEDVSKFSKLPRLFNAKRELGAIGELAGNEAAFYVEYNATRENFLKLDLSQFRIIHVVTHGVLDADRPELSGLVFSLIDSNGRPLDGFVSLADIYKLRAPVDLVVLSACHTALGQDVRGEGLVGLTRGFMYAGASGVVASLWKVDDRATAELMKYFYTNMLQGGMTPAAALRAAQNEIRSQPKWSSPYYWAGFTFQGDFDLIIKPAPPRVGKRIQMAVGAALMMILCAGGLYWYLRRPATPH